MKDFAGPDAIAALREHAFGEVSPAVEQGVIDRKTALDVMRRATLDAFPACRYAFGHGSALRGRFAAYSDLDVLALVPDGHFWEKRCINFEGYLVEIQACSLDILEPLILLAKRSGLSFGLLAGAGEIVVDEDGGAAALHVRLQQEFADGPLTPSDEILAGHRHALTNRLIELLGAPDPVTRIACGLSMFELLMRLELMLTTGWRHSGKWLPRVLPEAFPPIADAYAKLMTGDAGPLASIAFDLLDRIGGPVWSGYTMGQKLNLEVLSVAQLVNAALQMRF